MTVDVDFGSPPVLESAIIANHEATEARVFSHKGIADDGFDDINVDGILAADDAVDDLVYAWLEEEAAGRSERFVGVVRRRRAHEIENLLLCEYFFFCFVKFVSVLSGESLSLHLINNEFVK